jgi:hypothetical protein
MRTTITRAELHDFVSRVLGAPWTDTAEIVIAPDSVTVTTFRLDDNGRHYAVGGEAATQVTRIGLVGEVDARTVRMRHPDLPGQEITPSTSAAGHLAASGWEPVNAPLDNNTPEAGGADQHKPDSTPHGTSHDKGQEPADPPPDDPGAGGPKKPARRRKNPEGVSDGSA